MRQPRRLPAAWENLKRGRVVCRQYSTYISSTVPPSAGTPPSLGMEHVLGDAPLSLLRGPVPASCARAAPGVFVLQRPHQRSVHRCAVLSELRLPPLPRPQQRVQLSILEMRSEGWEQREEG